MRNRRDSNWFPPRARQTRIPCLPPTAMDIHVWIGEGYSCLLDLPGTPFDFWPLLDVDFLAGPKSTDFCSNGRQSVFQPDFL